MTSFENVLVWLPQLLLFALIMHDVFELSRNKQKQTIFDERAMLMMVLFFAFFFFLIDTGLSMTYRLFASQLSAYVGRFVGLFLLPAGYLLTKQLFYIQFGKDLEKGSDGQSAMFLHFFVFPSGAAMIFTSAYFLLVFLNGIL